MHIDGKTRPHTVINACDLKEGEEIRGFSGLENYIQKKTQLLYNQRIWEEANMDYSVGQILDDGRYPVDLVIYIKDTFNLIIFPNPRYSSNTGFSMTVNVNNYNFLGTMSQFFVETGYRYDEFERSNYLFEIDSLTPFRAFEKNWIFSFYNYLIYRPHLENPLYYANTTGFSVDFPLNSAVLTPAFYTSIVINQETYGVDNVVYSDRHSLYFTPVVELSSINLIGNFKKGFSGYIIQSYRYNIQNKKHEISPWRIYNAVAGIAHFTAEDSFFGISSRIMFRYWAWGAVYYYAGDALRGIVDRTIYANYMLSLNLDFPFRILKFRPSQWFGNEKLAFFNFDLHLSPVVDAAFYQYPADSADNKHFIASGAVEVILYPQRFRSSCLRVSVGRNLQDTSVTGKYEIYIGSSHFY